VDQTLACQWEVTAWHIIAICTKQRLWWGLALGHCDTPLCPSEGQTHLGIVLVMWSSHFPPNSRRYICHEPLICINFVVWEHLTYFAISHAQYQYRACEPMHPCCLDLIQCLHVCFLHVFYIFRSIFLQFLKTVTS